MDKFSLTNWYLFFLPLGNVDWTNYYYYYSFKKISSVGYISLSVRSAVRVLASS